MKRNYLKEKGITLIALVVTIVVLLILAGVTMNALFGDSGIIKRAQDAQNKMDQATQKDLEQIDALENWMNEHTGNNNGWAQNKTEVTNGSKTYTVGDEYDYDCGVSEYTGGWKVLGAENGKLLIMSTVDVGTLELSGKEGYNTGISKLNEMCTKYGTNARSITVEDINRVTGYDPKNQGDGTVYGTGEFYEYGNKVTYTASGSSATNGQKFTAEGMGYAHPDGRTIGVDNVDSNVDSITVESTAYNYYPYSLTQADGTTGECKGIAKDSPAYEMLFGTAEDTSNGTGNEYFLASLAIQAQSFMSIFNMFGISTGSVNSYFTLWDSTFLPSSSTAGVRAVVPL